MKRSSIQENLENNVKQYTHNAYFQAYPSAPIGIRGHDSGLSHSSIQRTLERHNFQN